MPAIQFEAMGCQMQAILDNSSPDAVQELARTPAWFADWERILSRFQQTSELTMLNHQAGTGWVQVSETLWEVLVSALSAARRSAGLVTPTVLPALKRAGYDRNFAELPRWNNTPGGAAHPVADWRAIHMDRRNRAVALPPAVQLDLGGIAKGWAADTAARRLNRFGPALVDAGGDIAIRGARANGTPWPIGIADPHKPDQYREILLLNGGGVATSGRDYRRWRQGGRERHHIIDPRTGEPAVTDIVTATVIAPSAREAEAAAKTTLILGGAAGRAWLERFPYLAAFLITDQGTIIRTANFDRSCWQTPVMIGIADE